MGFKACDSLKATKYTQSSSIYSSGEWNPSNLQLDQRKGLSISRHKYCLHQTQRFYIHCAAFNLKTYNTHREQKIQPIFQEQKQRD